MTRHRRGDERRPSSRSGGLQWGLGAVVAALTVAMLAVLLSTARSLDSAGGRFKRSSNELTTVANAQREMLRFEVAVRDLEADSSDSDSEDRVEIELHRGLLANQLRLVERREELHGESVAVFEQLQATLAQVDAMVSAPLDHAAIATLRDQTRHAEILMKRIFDNEEQRFYETTRSALDSSTRSQKVLIWLAVAAAIMGLGFVGWLRFRARSDLGAAYDDLLAEMHERRQIEIALRSSEERFRALVHNSSDMVAVVDPVGTIEYLSPSRRVLGYGPDEPCRTRSYLDFVHEDDHDQLLAILAGASADGAAAEYRMRHRDGTWRTVESVVTDLRDVGSVHGVVLNTRDITERKSYEDQLTHRAFHDPLTEVANRALFNNRLEHASAGLAPDGGRTIAVMLLDLDGFKSLNDTLGHAAGDNVLVATSQRLRRVLRTSDTVARFGGDEFAVLIEETTGDAVRSAAGRILAALAEPIQVGDAEARVTASIGVVLVDAPIDPAVLVRQADIALYAAKRGGKATFRMYSESMGADLLQRLTIENELRQQLELSQFELHYQPTVDLASGEIVGVEALIRWHHPHNGTMAPATFIPIAEETGVIVPLGDWVLERACTEVGKLSADIGVLTLNVNVSPRQLRDPGYVERVRDILVRTGFPGSRLVLEVTETTVMSDTEFYATVLAQLRELGIRVAVDDFGTGYSSLGYLRQLPIDILKIDRTFTEGLLHGTEESAVASAIVRLGRTMQLEVVAEGIEEPMQAAKLRRMHCPLGQGYYFARPMPAPELRHLLETSPTGVARAG